jgi:hypothetical protein
MGTIGLKKHTGIIKGFIYFICSVVSQENEVKKRNRHMKRRRNNWRPPQGMSMTMKDRGIWEEIRLNTQLRGI